MLNRYLARRGMTLFVLSITVCMVLAVVSSVFVTPVNAAVNFSAPLCGNGSAPDYGFTFDLQQAHWTVNWQNYVSEQTVTQVDTVLDQLNADSIAQTMILIQPYDQVGNQVNCAVHFLRYMELGLPSGERKDNGFVFLIVVEPTRINVHYGVGLGLPALTAPELTSLNRSAEENYQSTHSLDQALLTLVNGFDKVARDNYAPLVSPVSTSESTTQPMPPSGPMSILSTCGLVCIGLFFLLFFMWALPMMARSGINFNPSGSNYGGRGFPLGGGRNSPPSTRGGSGSGRSNRGN